IDVFLAAGAEAPQAPLVEEAAERARAYLAAGAACVYPILLYEREAVAAFVPAAGGPVNLLALPKAPPFPELAQLGVARVSFGGLLYRATMQRCTELLAAITS